MTDPFFSQVVTDGGCEIWVGPTTADGYARFCVNGQQWLAHRWAWYQVSGADAPPLKNTCGRPLCVHPAHWSPRA